MILNTVRLPHRNAAAEIKTISIPTPKQVIISMSQNAGVPCDPLVKVGDYVTRGQKIGESASFVSTPVHASVTGTVSAIGDITLINGKSAKTLVIDTDFNVDQKSPETLSKEIVKPTNTPTREQFIEYVKQSGLVGLGGAGFPTHVKLNYDRSKVKIEYLVINAAECEPYITSDYRELVAHGEEILDGMRVVMKHLEIPKGIIGIENDKPKAIKHMNKLINELRQGQNPEASINHITVKVLPSRYPQGAEKVLIYNTTGRVIKEGEFPLHAGCIVMNCSTVSFIEKYMHTGKPLITRRLTIDGNGMKDPKNIRVPIGTPLQDIIDFAEKECGLKRDALNRVIFGGPMMGNSIYDMNMPITKTTNAVLMFSDIDNANKSTPCIRCGRCIKVCSMNLMPTELENAYDHKDIERLKKLKVNLCMECGACSFICPANRNLAEKNSLAKRIL